MKLKYFFSAVLTACLALAFTACSNEEDSPEVKAEPKVETALTFDTDTVSVGVGETTTFNITAGGGEYKAFSENPDVATMTIDGNKISVTAVKSGFTGIVVSDAAGNYKRVLVKAMYKTLLLDKDEVNMTIKVGHTDGYALLTVTGGNGGYEAVSDHNDIVDIYSIENGVITIADEVMTGFGRTGRTFASNYLIHKPDIMCLSKALTGGTIPLAVTTATQEIFDGFYSEDVNKALFHGHTFTANPTGCAIALEAIRILESDEMQANLQRIARRHQEFLARIAKYPSVENARTLGVILAFDLKTTQNTDYYGSFRDKLYNFFISEGVILRPVGNIIYILPPYIITDKQLDRVYNVLEQAIQKFSNQ